MKMQIMMTIETEIVRKLREMDNYSRFVNSLLEDYFKDPTKSKLKEVQKEKEQLIEKSQELLEQANDLELVETKLEKQEIIKEQKIEKLLTKIPQEIIDDFKAFPNMTLDILRTRFKEIYLGHYNISWSDLENAFNNEKDFL
jgi:galactose-1-phosphate uridylyltransferase